MEKFEIDWSPARPFGLNNTGVICHFNSLLQALISCTRFNRAVMQNKDYMMKTTTGKAVYNFVSCFCDEKKAKNSPDIGIESQSRKVLAALVDDLKVRRPTVQFGNSQESASEGLVLLLDMLEPADESAHPITRLFVNIYECTKACLRCKKVSDSKKDMSVQVSAFHMSGDELKDITNEKKFSKTLRTFVVNAKDVYCESCKEKTTSKILYRMVRISEIVVCTFNIYKDRPHRFIPESFELPTKDDKVWYVFRQAGDVEHHGGLNGGHYTARGLRGDSVFIFNDSAQPTKTM